MNVLFYALCALFLVDSATSLEFSCKYEDSGKGVCLSSFCQSFSIKMLSYVNLAVDPCEDFYSFACGSVEDSRNLYPEDPENEVNRKIKEELETTIEADSVMSPAKTFYDACTTYFENRINTQAKKYARDVIGRVGNFTSEKSEIDNNTNLTSIFSQFLKINFAPFFDIGMEIDPSPGGLYVPRITLPQNHLQLSQSKDVRNCLRKFERSSEEFRKRNKTLDLNKSYNDYVLTCMSKDSGLKAKLDRMSYVIKSLSLTDSIVGEAEKEKIINAARYQTELILTQITPIILLKNETKRSPHDLLEFDVVTVQELDSGKVLGSVINWKQLLEILTGQSVQPDQKIHLYHKEELVKIIEVLEMEWNGDHVASHNSMLMLWSEYIYSSLIEPLGRKRNYCLVATKHLLPDISSALYLHSFVESASARLHRSIETLAKSIRSEIVRIMENHGSVSPALIKKMSEAKFDIGETQEEASNNKSIKHSMEGVLLNKNHYHNVDVLLQRHRRLYYGLINKDRTSTDALWLQGIVPFRTSGVTVRELNKIFIPYGVMTSPYFYGGRRARLPDYVNYAGLGYIIASQFLHLIDRTGVMFDSMGNIATPQIAATGSYVYASECLSEQIMYQRFSSRGLNATANFMQPPQLNDLLASSGAARVSWFTYLSTQQDGGTVRNWTYSAEDDMVWLGKRPLTPLQTYFLRMAQTQCQRKSDIDLLSIMSGTELSPPLRVNLVVGNEPLFEKAFKCKKENAMVNLGACPFSLDLTSV